MAKYLTRRAGRMAREVDPAPCLPPSVKTPSKLDRVEAMLLQGAGASIAEIMAVTNWQQHSVRGVMAGALKKRGLVISSDKIDGTRYYRAEKPA